MKKLLLPILVMLMSLPALAFEYNGLNYNVTSQTERTVEVGWYNGFAGDIVIPETVVDNGIIYSVTSIGTYAFYDCTGLTSVEIPNSVTSIGDLAFWGCSGLTSVEIPNSVTSIGWSAFMGCSSLTSVEIPNSVTSIGEGAFANCSGLTSVEIPNSVTYIGSEAFFDCPIESLAIDCANIENWFAWISSLKDLTIGNSVTSIGENAFYGCTGLTSIEIPNSVNSIGGSAFYGCPIESLSIDCANIENWFAGISSLKDLTIGNSVNSIGNYAFNGCSGLTSVEIPNTVTSLGDGVFKDCRSLTSVEIPGSLTSIGRESFRGCSSLTGVEIPSSVTTIGENAFYGAGIINLTIPKTVQSIGEGCFSANPIENLVVYTGCSITNTITFNSLKEVIFGDDATTIPSFAGASLLTDVTLPTSLEYLPDNAFSYCTSLKNLDLPAGLTRIGSFAFNGCSALENLSIPEKVTSIGSAAFAQCSSLIKMELPDAITSLQDNLFANCISLEKVSYSDNVQSFGNNVFYNCPSLRSIHVPNGITSIPDNFLANSTSVTEIILPNTVTSIGQRAFANCLALMNVVMGTGTYTIGNYAFDGCSNLSDIYCMASIPPYAEQYTFPLSSYSSATLYVPEQALTKYSSQDPWQRFSIVNTMNSGIQLSHYEVNMAGNQVFQLGVYGTDNKVTWTASNPDVAYANECGLVVGRGVTGSSIITATVDGVSVECRVNIVSPRQTKGTRATEGDIEPVDMIIESIGGKPAMVNLRLIPVGSKTVIDWSTSDSSIATVEDGLVTIKNEGDIEFGAETGNGLEDSYEINTEDIDTSGISFATTAEERRNGIYTLQGIQVKQNATQSDIDALSPGLYIIGGKKVIIR